MLQANALSGGPVFVLLAVSSIFGGLMAGFFFANSVSVVLALETLSASEYVRIVQDINDKLLNAVFGLVFFGAIIVPIGGTVLVVLRGGWATRYGQSFLAGAVVYLIGTAFVTFRIHIPMNERIATWSPASPPAGWEQVRKRWKRWNHVRTVAAAVSFTLYLVAIASFRS